MKKITLFLLSSLCVLLASAQLQVTEAAKPVNNVLAEYTGKHGLSFGKITQMPNAVDTIILFTYPDAQNNYDGIGSFYFKKRADAKELWDLIGKMLADPDETKKYDVKVTTGILNLSKSKKSVMILNMKNTHGEGAITSTVFLVDQKIYDKLNVL
jgi:hypothetical protein